MDGSGRECGEANGNVLGSLGGRVLHPFAWVGDHGLARGDVDRAGFVGDAEHALQDYRMLLEFRSLAWLDPSWGALHARNAHCLGFRVHATDKFFDDFWLVAGGFNSSGPRDERWHFDLPG